MKGFKKDGKFRPTEKRNKVAGISKKDLERAGKSLRNQQKKKFPDDMTLEERMRIMNSDVEENKERIMSNTTPIKTREEVLAYQQDPRREEERKDELERRRAEMGGLAGRTDYWMQQGLSEDDAFQYAKEDLGYRDKKTFGDYEVECECKGKDKNCKYCHGKGSSTWTSQVGNKKTLEDGCVECGGKKEKGFDRCTSCLANNKFTVPDDRDKQTIGEHSGHPLVLEDNGKLYEEFPDHVEEVYKQPPHREHRHKFGIFGEGKSEQQKASEEKAKQEEHEQKVLQKQDETQDKNNKKRAKEIAKHIQFLEKHMEGLEKKPAKFGVNANTQLENLEESRKQKRELQAELDEINKVLDKPQVRHKKGAKPFTNMQHKQERAEFEITAQEYDPIRNKNTLKGVSETELHDALGHAGIDPSGAIGNYPKSHLRKIVEEYRSDMAS